jgi:hypothetical protein
MAKHFNKGVVWGKIKTLKTRTTKANGKPYAELRILCPSEGCGDVLVYARLWGKIKVEAVKKAFKSNPGQAYKFKGLLSQFKKSDKVLTGFNLFSLEPTDDLVGLRAVFILVGGLEERHYNGGTALLKVRVKQGGDYPTDDLFEIYASEKAAEQLDVLALVQVKGKMRDMDAEWGSSGDLRPFADEMKSIQKKEPF